MFILLSIDVVCLILGILLLIGKQYIKKIENFLNRAIVSFASDDKQYSIVGVLLIIFSFVLFVIVMSLKR